MNCGILMVLVENYMKCLTMFYSSFAESVICRNHSEMNEMSQKFLKTPLRTCCPKNKFLGCLLYCLSESCTVLKTKEFKSLYKPYLTRRLGESCFSAKFALNKMSKIERFL